jgi:penicillin-binding protein 2
LINDPFKPLRNKVIQDHYSPGSTFKPFMALAALQEGLLTANTVVFSPSKIRFGNRYYHDHSKTGYGHISLPTAMERSSNVFFYKLGIQLGVDRYAKYAAALGIGRKTGVQMANEESGLMPTREWKQRTFGEDWQPGENLSNAIGQGYVLTTALQMAVAYNAIATEGQVVQPYLVLRVIGTDDAVKSENQPQIIRDVSDPNNGGVFISKQNFKTVKESMRRVANGAAGTARWWKIPGVEMAGKTGTSQVMSFSADRIYDKCETRPIRQRHHGWYIAWAPADKPEITVAALAEHACHGSSGAAPIVRDVIQAYFEKYHPQIIAEGKKRQRLSPQRTDIPQPEPEEPLLPTPADDGSEGIEL